ncbi:MAG: hypothetical protein E7111_02580 [Bacteroidales bacterium]|nr:hypothetical protein [Bacteroidales bacterium]
MENTNSFRNIIILTLSVLLTSCLGLEETDPPQELLSYLSTDNDISAVSSANCYIVSETGAYKFRTVKGNSAESVGAVASAEVLWESFGTDVAPAVGDLIKSVKYSDGYIAFQTADTFKEGNAVIAAKEANGNILWSWHIWLTDQPQGQEYFNGAGTMMDRNLGATSATPGDVGALGLMYQWGRKDPFLGSSSISENVVAASTIIWPSEAKSDVSFGTIAYATAHPTTFIYYNINNDDWYYSIDKTTDNTRWTTSESAKSIYDPCPAGWRVPDGGDSGVWSRALGSSSSFSHSYLSVLEGMNFFDMFGNISIIWYPASGCRSSSEGRLNSVGIYGSYWSASPLSNKAYRLNFNEHRSVNPSNYYNRANGQSVRCILESSVTAPPAVEPPVEESQYVDISEDETANSYIVSDAGAYKFASTRGNSAVSVGAVASAEVLWESFGTDTAPAVGDLIKSVKYSDGYIAFQTASAFKEGNAVIAAKDASGNILWSWHIWLTDRPQGQEYYNGAGTMMDRNLGATSATPGDVGALGLLYQWGRKDPFLGSSSISSSTTAKSTISWPSAVETSSSVGTVSYVTAHPTIFVTASSSPYDWHYSSRNNSLWTTSDKTKSISDPCPAGWRVPDGGDDGVWSKALGSSEYFTDESLYNSSNEGMNFSGKFGSASTIWYPASGCLGYGDGGLYSVGLGGLYWSASPYSYGAYALSLDNFGPVDPSIDDIRADGLSVRCLQVIDEVAGANAEESK